MTTGTVSVRPLWRVTSVMAVLALLLGACKTTLGDEGMEMSAAERDLRKETEAQRVAEGAKAGVVVGAIAGTVLGALIGGRTGNAGTGALIGGLGGAVAGGAIGAAYGSYVNARSQRYANAEARANTITAEADKDIAHYARVNQHARTILAEQQAKIPRLNDAYKARTINKEAFEKEMAISNNNEKILRDQCKAIDDQITSMQSDPQAAAMSKQIAELSAQRDALKASYDRLVQLYTTVPVEVRGSTS